MSEERDLSVLIVPRTGGVVAGGDLWEPVRIVDAAGDPVTAVATFLKDLQASGRSESTQRSYAMDLLRWFRFLWAIEVPWDGQPEQRPATSADGSHLPTRQHEAPPPPDR